MASDLLEKRSSIYSSRPSSVMMNDLYVFIDFDKISNSDGGAP